MHPEGIIDTITRNIERAWLEMPECVGNPREKTRMTGACDIDGDYLEETRIDEDVLQRAEDMAHSCCPIGHPGAPGPQGVK